jgi:hypothetical protein
VVGPTVARGAAPADARGGEDARSRDAACGDDGMMRLVVSFRWCRTDAANSWIVMPR